MRRRLFLLRVLGNKPTKTHGCRLIYGINKALSRVEGEVISIYIVFVGFLIFPKCFFFVRV